MNERMMAMFCLVACSGLFAAPAVSDKPPPSDEDLAWEREGQRLREQAAAERAAERKLREAARHPATQWKPKSASLERILGKKRRYA